jgi:hypothetical protein
VTGSFEAMMSVDDIDLIKMPRNAPESVEYAEGSLDNFAKDFMDRQIAAAASQRKTKIKHCEGPHNRIPSEMANGPGPT